MKKALLILVSCLILAGCAANPINQKLYDDYMTQSFDYSKDKCFNATLAALKEFKTGVEKKDKDKGIIITERAEFYKLVEVTGNEYAASGQTFVATHKYYLKITGNKTHATVTVTRYRMWKNNVEQTELNAGWCNENVWVPFFKTIKEKLEES